MLLQYLVIQVYHVTVVLLRHKASCISYIEYSHDESSHDEYHIMAENI